MAAKPKSRARTQPIPPKFEAGYLSRLDKRTTVANELRERYEELTNDLGGAEHLSYQQRSLVERALWLEHWLHLQERELCAGRTDGFEAGRWVQSLNALVGLFRAVGLERQSRNVTDLQTYIAGKAS